MASWQLTNAEELRKEAPYTFYKPSDEIIALLKAGESTVQLIFSFESDDAEAPAAERMWVFIDELDQSGNYTGRLDNEPFYTKDLKVGDVIQFKKEHIIAYETIDGTIFADPLKEYLNQFEKTCFVSNHIMEEGYPVGRLYLEDLEDDDEYSGWTLLSNHETDEYMEDHTNLQYISLGAVLNIDDSFIHLLNEPIGADFLKDDETGEFFECPTSVS